MKTVGFIDYYLDEWHANNYPEWIKNQSGGEFEVKFAYAASEPTIEGRISNSRWAEEHEITLVESIEELLDLSDCIIVLSPDNPEMHYKLSKEALKTGKPVYIDKTFAESKADAQKIFEIAEKYNTPCFSSSALRFSEKLAAVKKDDIASIVSFGGGSVSNYIIHQLEPVMILLGSDAERVMYVGNESSFSWIVSFKNRKTVYINILDGDFSMRITHTDYNETVDINDDFFKGLINALIEFFKTGKIPVSHSDTVKLMALRECCIKAMEKPLIWFEILKRG